MIPVTQSGNKIGDTGDPDEGQSGVMSYMLKTLNRLTYCVLEYHGQDLCVAFKSLLAVQ